MKKINQKAFTLIELLLVISIIALLSSIIISSTMDSRNKAKVANIQQSLISLRNEAELFRTTHGSYLVSANTFNSVCPSSATTNWGFFGTSNSIQVLDQIRDIAGGSVDDIECAVARDGWAIYINGSALMLSGNFINRTFAATQNGICYDSEGRYIVELNSSSSNNNWGSAYTGFPNGPVGSAFANVTESGLTVKYICKE